MRKKLVSALCLCAMVCGIFAGCGQSSQTASKADSKSSETSSASKDKEESGKPLKWMIKASEAGREENKKLVALAKENGYDVEIVALPDPEAGSANKFLISLMGGDDFDLAQDAYANMIQYQNAGMIEPMAPLAKKAGYDMKTIFGDYPAKFNGEIYGAPAYVDTAITIYNKKVFDDAGVPYPTAEGWTWEKFIETGKKISNPKKGIYGAYNPLWAHYNYMLAMQKGASHYKQDGTSNYDDPLFAESIKFYYGLGNTEKIQPDYLTQKSKQMPVDYFTTGKVGMSVAGGWTTVWLTDKTKYPRDWKAGVLPMPYPEGSPKSKSVVVSNFWIPTTSKQKDAAFKVATLFAENQYKMGAGRIPARANLSEEQIETYIQKELLPMFEADGITVADIKNMWFDSKANIFDEKVVGGAAADINKVFVEQCSLYGIGEQNLETTMKNIKSKADEAIKTAKK